MTRSLPHNVDRHQLAALPHQEAAISAAVEHLLVNDQPRATIVMPCGTGKTLVATLIAAKVATWHETVLVTVPTLALLEQSVREWMAHSPRMFTALAFCSDEDMDSPDYAQLMVPTTTDPAILSGWIRNTDGPIVVFATYQSTPTIADGHEAGSLNAWGLIVADEAHRTVTEPGSAFSAVVDEDRIWARKRVFLTATPRTRMSGDRLVSMSDTRRYGPIVYSLGLREAIDTGLLSSYEVVVVAVTDADVRTLLDGTGVHVDLLGGGHRPLSEVAKQVALARVAADRDLRSVMVFHNTVARSEGFAETFSPVARIAHPPTGLSWTARHVDGWTDRADRREALDTLADPGAGKRCVLSNVRVFTEGLDVPELDAVMFADPRTSQVDIAQAVGRALRRHPDHDRPALVILPVVLPGPDVSETARTAFGSVLHALQALMDADPAIEQAVRSATTTGNTPADEGGVPRVSVTAAPELARRLYAAMSTLVGPPIAQRRWLDTVELLQDYVAEHHRLPASGTVYRGVRLGKWVSHQRHLYSLGTLVSERQVRLEQVSGWAWSYADAKFAEGYAHLLTWFGYHGNVTPQRSATVDGYAVGAWRAGCVKAHREGSLPPAHRMRLEQLPGWTWDEQTRDWERGLGLLTRWAAVHDGLDALDEHVFFDGFALGSWWGTVRAAHRRGTLDPEQVRQVTAAARSYFTDNIAEITERDLAS